MASGIAGGPWRSEVMGLCVEGVYSLKVHKCRRPRAEDNAHRLRDIRLLSMNHNHIVAMIDACLERLHAARRLLSNQKQSSVVDELLQSTDARMAPAKKKARPAIRNKKKQRDELTPELFAPNPATGNPAPQIFTPAAEVRAVPTVEVVPKQIIVAAPRKRSMARSMARPPTPPAPHRKAAIPQSALVGHVPSGPVFIPAAQIPQERAKSRIENASTNLPEAAPLTAELLAQRWIQSAGF